MQRFFFNIRENGVLKHDHEGVLCVDADQACHGANEAMIEFAQETAAVTAYWPVVLEVTDEQGLIIATIRAEDCRRKPINDHRIVLC